MEGLTTKEAEQGLVKYGKNILRQQKKKSPIMLFFGQFKDVMTMILLACTGVSAFMQDWIEAIVMVGIVVVNALMGFVQEFRTEKTIEALRSMTAMHARVKRDGKIIDIKAEMIVPGDVVIIKRGDVIPADGDVLEANDLTVDEAMLTGESVAVEKTSKAGALPSNEEHWTKVYSGTMVLTGSATVRITETGMNTRVGKISGMIQEVKEESTPLQKRLAKMGVYIVVGCMVICVIVTITGMLRGEEPINMLLTGISLAVAAVPEGLPAIVTISLALGVQRMAAKNALVRRLPAVETLGSTTIICSDKTGTLTQNIMTVREIYKLSNRLVTVFRICNNCADATEKALSQMGDNNTQEKTQEKTQEEAQNKSGEYKRIAEIPFDSNRKCMSVIVKNKNGEYYMMTKGGADVVLSKAALYESDVKIHKIQKIDAAARKKFQEKNNEMASKALRVLAGAYKKLTKEEVDKIVKDKKYREQSEKNLIFLGFAGLADPPRKEVPGAVKLCETAGIRTIMITGDHKVTAAAVAKEVNIPSETVLTGEEITAMSEADFEKAVEKVNVYARVLPEHKLKIVRALKKKNNIVAMTGDGVNDAPAIKEADIGVAMGINGTDVTREASDMVLMDDNFATIAEAVKQGRGIYYNIRKFIRYMLACNLGEVITMFAAMLMGLPLPLYPIQILWVNLVTDGLPGIALGLDPVEEDIMKKKPIAISQGLFSGRLPFLIIFRGILLGLCTLGAFVVVNYSTENEEIARTAAFLTLVMTQLVHSFECRSETKGLLKSGIRENLWLLSAGAFSMLLMLAVIYVPTLSVVFKTVALNWNQLAVVACFTAVGPIIGGIVNEIIFLAERK